MVLGRTPGSDEPGREMLQSTRDLGIMTWGIQGVGKCLATGWAVAPALALG